MEAKAHPMKVLVTGSEGCIGHRLVAYLELMGHEVLCLDIAQRHRRNYILSNILNLTDAEEEIMKFKPQVVYHLASMVSRVTCEKSISMAVETNVAGTANIVQLCKRTGAKLINFSTSEVYGNQGISMEEGIALKPNNIYGITKYMAEQLIEYESKSGALKYINVRPFMIYDENEQMGENRSAMIRFAENISKGLPVTVHRDSYRSWLHISDAVVLFERLLNAPDNTAINIGSNYYISAEKMAMFMCRYIDSPSLLNYEDLPDKMTLKKYASFDLQRTVLHYEPLITVEDGMMLVMDVIINRIRK